MNGIESIAAERQRQIEKEGWTPEHDDDHDSGELALAAINYIAATIFRNKGLDPKIQRPGVGGVFAGWWSWPWFRHWWKPQDSRADLVRAGALIAAEIDRLDRAEACKSEQS